jgi:hypothetical protein
MGGVPLSLHPVFHELNKLLREKICKFTIITGVLILDRVSLRP